MYAQQGSLYHFEQYYSVFQVGLCLFRLIIHNSLQRDELVKIMSTLIKSHNDTLLLKAERDVFVLSR